MVAPPGDRPADGLVPSLLSRRSRCTWRDLDRRVGQSSGALRVRPAEITLGAVVAGWIVGGRIGRSLPGYILGLLSVWLRGVARPLPLNVVGSTVADLQAGRISGPLEIVVAAVGYAVYGLPTGDLRAPVPAPVRGRLDRHLRLAASGARAVSDRPASRPAPPRVGGRRRSSPATRSWSAAISASCRGRGTAGTGDRARTGPLGAALPAAGGRRGDRCDPAISSDPRRGRRAVPRPVVRRVQRRDDPVHRSRLPAARARRPERRHGSIPSSEGRRRGRRPPRVRDVGRPIQHDGDHVLGRRNGSRWNPQLPAGSRDGDADPRTHRVAAGCDGGTVTTQGVALAAVFWIGAVAVAAFASSASPAPDEGTLRS